jgi:2-keto-4-pentenoate hydratase/2-oxohepta-3-ene-1,7-dioic acid hydratase in catechol pathway
MKLLRYSIEDETSYGILEEDQTIRQLISTPFDNLETSGVITHLDEVQVLTPVERPRVIGVGLNYVAHAHESGKPLPEIPLLFMKPSTAVIAHEEAIVYPSQGEEVHYEAELAVVIGKSARRVSQTEALDYVLGYTCGNDVSERVIQSAEMSMGAILIGKGFDTFCPLGPYIVTDLDPTNLDIKARLNGVVKQDSNTSDLLFAVDQLVSYISEGMTLIPGDVIMTGTPSGVGPVTPGDVVEIEISGIGILRNPVVAEAA